MSLENINKSDLFYCTRNENTKIARHRIFSAELNSQETINTMTLLLECSNIEPISALIVQDLVVGYNLMNRRRSDSYVADSWREIPGAGRNRALELQAALSLSRAHFRSWRRLGRRRYSLTHRTLSERRGRI